MRADIESVVGFRDPRHPRGLVAMAIASDNFYSH
jgi:hypothetical protein